MKRENIWIDSGRSSRYSAVDKQTSVDLRDHMLLKHATYHHQYMQKWSILQKNMSISGQAVSVSDKHVDESCPSCSSQLSACRLLRPSQKKDARFWKILPDPEIRRRVTCSPLCCAAFPQVHVQFHLAVAVLRFCQQAVLGTSIESKMIASRVPR